MRAVVKPLDGRGHGFQDAEGCCVVPEARRRGGEVPDGREALPSFTRGLEKPVELGPQSALGPDT